MSDFLDFGFVLKPHGVRGELRIQSHSTQFSAESFTSAPEEICLWARGTDPHSTNARIFEVTGWRNTQGAVIARLHGIDGRDAAQELKGQQVGVSRALVSELEEDEFFLQDLLGCTVLSEAGVPLGKVGAIYDNHGQDLIALTNTPGHGSKELLVPIGDGTIVDFDPHASRLTLRIAEGLLNAQSTEHS